MKRNLIFISFVTFVAILLVASHAAAMHHPALGRFIQRDPGAGGQSVLRYQGVTDTAVTIDARMEFPRNGSSAESSSAARQFVSSPVIAEGRPDAASERALRMVPRPSGVQLPRQREILMRYADGMNLYAYVRLNPSRWRDPSGLEIMICTTPKRWYLLGGKHAYLWDTTQNQSCGQSGSSGSGGSYTNGYPDGNQPGPAGKGHTCNSVPDSDGKEKCVMDWCKENMNKGLWIPFLWDCHTRVEKALEACCLSDEGVPHPRF